VIPENAAASALYRSVGFTEEGRQRGFLKLPGGSRHDHVLMAVFVKPGLAPPGYSCWPPPAADGG
jgi:RimJ/RimL family protein N-acetyltransferase